MFHVLILMSVYLFSSAWIRLVQQFGCGLCIKLLGWVPTWQVWVDLNELW